MDERVAVLVAIAVGLVLAVTILFFVIPEPANRALIATERLDVVILPFRNSSSWPGAEETLASKIEGRLAGAAGVNVFSRAQLDEKLIERAAGGPLDRPTATEIGSLTGASKLITGTVYAVDTYTRDTTICVKWENGDCVEEAPATEYKVLLAAQIEIVDTETGMIERSLDLSDTETTTLRAEITSAYTREIRYGIYQQVEEKGTGYVGKGETIRFHEGETLHLIVHFARIREGDTFDLALYAPDGTSLKTVEDVVSKGDWRHYQFDLTGIGPGRYRIQGILNGTEAFEEAFTVSP